MTEMTITERIDFIMAISLGDGVTLKTLSVGIVAKRESLSSGKIIKLELLLFISITMLR